MWPVDPSLFGQLRLRCWADGESRPSLYSEAVSLPRWKGKVEGVDAVRLQLAAVQLRNRCADFISEHR